MESLVLINVVQNLLWRHLISFISLTTHWQMWRTTPVFTLAMWLLFRLQLWWTPSATHWQGHSLPWCSLSDCCCSCCHWWAAETWVQFLKLHWWRYCNVTLKVSIDSHNKGKPDKRRLNFQRTSYSQRDYSPCKKLCKLLSISTSVSALPCLLHSFVNSLQPQIFHISVKACLFPLCFCTV